MMVQQYNIFSRRFGKFCLFGTVMFMVGCATIFTGTTDTISFSSNVDPVRVYLGGRNVGVTPITLEVNRQTQRGPLVRFEKEGYKPQEFYLGQQFNWVSVLDISSIVTSGGIDVLTGSIMEFSPKQYHVEMLKDSQANLKDNERQLMFARYVLFNAENIQKDISLGSGEYLDNLISLDSSNGYSKGNLTTLIRTNREILLRADNSETLLALLRQDELAP